MPVQTTSYRDTLLVNLDEIEYQFTDILDRSSIQATNLPSNFIGFASHRWAPSNDELTASRMATLRNLRDFEPRFRLLFAHPTPEVGERLDAGFGHLYRWLDRDTDDHSIPATAQAAQAKLPESSRISAALPAYSPTTIGLLVSSSTPTPCSTTRTLRSTRRYSASATWFTYCLSC